MKLQLTPSRQEPSTRFGSNEEIVRAWVDFNKTRLQTYQKYEARIRRFTDAWGDTLVTTLRARDIWTYVQALGQWCRYLYRAPDTFTGLGPEGPDGMRCRKKLDLETCGEECPGYDALMPQSVEKHLDAVKSLYDFLVHVEAVDHNYARDVAPAWLRENKHRADSHERRIVTKDEVERLVDATPHLSHKVLYMILAKTGLRIGEAMALVVDSEHFNLKEGWMKIPDVPGARKRRGNRFVIIDPQIAQFLRPYMGWRKRILQGKPPTDKLLVNVLGREYHEKNEAVHEDLLPKDCARAGIEMGTRRYERLTAHSFRHFFSDHISRQGLTPGSFWWHVLRGDRVKGTQGVYVHPTIADIRDQYRRFAPTFDVSTPV